MRAFPTELEADIARSYPGRSLLEWWRTVFGLSREMATRELWVFIKGLGESSLYRTALREGDWSEDQRIQALIATQLGFLRYDQAVIAGQKMRKPESLLSPKERREKAEAREFQVGIHDLLLQTMRGEITAPTRDVTFTRDDQPVKKLLRG